MKRKIIAVLIIGIVCGVAQIIAAPVAAAETPVIEETLTPGEAEEAEQAAEPAAAQKPAEGKAAAPEAAAAQGAVDGKPAPAGA